MANQTLYTFKANLQDLVKLKIQLDEATAKLNKLKATDKAYKAQAQEKAGLATSYNKQAKAMAGATTQANKMNKAGGRLVNTFKSAAVAIAAAFAVRAITGSIRSIISTFSEFEAQMAAVKAISGATNEEFQTLERTALKLGASTIFTATQVGQLQEEFARLGFSVEEIDAATVSTLNLAAATGESLANSAQVAGSTLRAFNLDAEQTQRVTDVMAQSFTNSALNLDKFKESMKFVAPVARATGFTIEETSSLLMQLADNGLSGSIAGNALKNVFLKLGDANSKLAKKLGGPVQGIPQLAEAMRKLSEEGFSATEAVDLLDKRSAPAFLALIKNIDGLEAGVETLNKAEGAVNRMAAIRLDTLQGDFTILKSATEGLSIALGEEFDTSLRNIVYSLTNFTQSITESEGALAAIRTTVQLLGVAITALTARFAMMGIIGVYKGIIQFGRGLKLLTIQLGRATTAQAALNVVTKANPFVLVATVVGTLVGAYFLLGEEASEAEMKQRRLNDALNDSIEDILGQNDATKERAASMRQFVNEFPGLLKFLDLERASNAQLLEIKKLMGNADLSELAAKQKKNDVERQLAQERIELINEELKAQRLAVKEAENNFGVASREAEVAREEVFWSEERRKVLRGNVEAYKSSNQEIEEEIKSFVDKLGIANNIIIKDGATLRNELKTQYVQRLNDFRELKEGEQEIKLQENKDRLEFLQDAIDYNQILGKSVEQFGFVTKEAQELADATIAKSPFKDAILNTNVSVQDLSIELSELRKFVSNLDSAFVKTADSTKKFGDVTSFALNKTKDQFKKLNKLFDDMIEERLGKQRLGLQSEYATAKKAGEEELALMVSNQDNINSFIATGKKEEIASLIKANKSKFDAIKNLTAKEYAAAIDAEKGNKDDMIAILEAMLAEEAEKIETSNDYLEQLEENHKTKMKQIEIEGSTADAGLLFEEEMLEAASLERKELQFFSSMKKRKDARVKLAKVETTAIDLEEDRQLTNLKALKDLGKITEQEYQDSKTRIVKQAANERSVIEQKQFEENKKQALATLEFISDRYNMAFDAFSTFMSNRLALETQAVNETYDLQSEQLNNSMTAELDGLEGNQEAQEDVREHYRILQEANEAKKQEELRKIKKKEFQIDKANNLIQAGISGAMALITTAGKLGFPAILAAAPILTGLIAAQIAAIASAKFVGAKGGIIPDGEKFAKDEVALDSKPPVAGQVTKLDGGEAVINKKSTAMFKDELSDINVAGGGVKFKDGGMVVGPSHKEGGVKFSVNEKVVELEGGEAVINRKSTAMFRSQLSAMNEAGGGVKFADGGIMPGTSNIIQSSGVSNQQIQLQQLAGTIVSGINSKEVTVTEADITSSQSSVSVTELTSSIF
tara:strand:- start:1663 stop:5790 length:4128 start_codon:yes stop_codon:yes gene_type:complete